MEDTEVCAYLDLLGFSNYLMEDQKGAEILLNNYATILMVKLTNDKITQEDFEIQESLRSAYELTSFNSIENFIPFSDSIFITSSNANLFVKQISHFLVESFNFCSKTYISGGDQNEVMKSTGTQFTINEDETITMSEYEQINYPVLFRGGISAGDINGIFIDSIENKVAQKKLVLNSKNVVESVKLEKSDKGPRLFCNQKFVDCLDETNQKIFICATNKSSYEVLYPIVIFSEGNSFEDNFDKFVELFEPAVNLWKALNHHEYGIHYYKFLRLIIKSAYRFFEMQNQKKESEEKIKDLLIKQNLDLKIKDLQEIEYI